MIERINNKKGYIDLIFTELKKSTYGMYIWEKIENKGLSNKEHIKLNNNWHSIVTRGKDKNGKDVGVIILGIGNMEDNERKKYIFLDNTLNNIDITLYFFTHELSHFITFGSKKYSNYGKELFDGIKLTRENGYGGLSMLGEHPTYKTIEEQSEEDFTELINMYINSPKYLQSFLQILSNTHPNRMKFKKEHGLTTLSQLSCKKILKLTENIVNEFLNS